MDIGGWKWIIGYAEVGLKGAGHWAVRVGCRRRNESKFFVNFNNFNITGIEFNVGITKLFSLIFPVMYGILYIILVLTLTAIIFRKRIF